MRWCRASSRSPTRWCARCSGAASSVWRRRRGGRCWTIAGPSRPRALNSCASANMGKGVVAAAPRLYQDSVYAPMPIVAFLPACSHWPSQNHGNSSLISSGSPANVHAPTTPPKVISRRWRLEKRVQSFHLRRRSSLSRSAQAASRAASPAKPGIAACNSNNSAERRRLDDIGVGHLAETLQGVRRRRRRLEDGGIGTGAVERACGAFRQAGQTDEAPQCGAELAAQQRARIFGQKQRVLHAEDEAVARDRQHDAGPQQQCRRQPRPRRCWHSPGCPAHGTSLKPIVKRQQAVMSGPRELVERDPLGVAPLEFNSRLGSVDLTDYCRLTLIDHLILSSQWASYRLLRLRTGA